MNETKLTDIFIQDDYNYLKNNLINKEGNDYIFEITAEFFIRKKDFSSKFLAPEEILKLINNQDYGIGTFLQIYKKIGIIKNFEKLTIKRKDQIEFYERMKDSKDWDYILETCFFDYKITLDINQLNILGYILYEEKKGFLSLRFINELVKFISSVGLTPREIIDFYEREKNTIYHFYNTYLLVYYLSLENNYHILINKLKNICKDGENEEKLNNLINFEFNNTMSFMNGENTSIEDIQQFLNEINGLRKFAEEGVLEISKQGKLLTRIREYNYEKNIDDEIFILKIKKKLSKIQSMYSERNSGGMSGAIAPQILEWEALFLEYLGKNSVEQKKEIQSDEKIIKLGDNIHYLPEKHIFQNQKNSKEYNIKDHGNYDKIMDILIKNKGDFVTYDKIIEESGMEILLKKSDARQPQKRVTDAKGRLLKHVSEKLEVEKINFIKVNNGLKLIIV